MRNANCWNGGHAYLLGSFDARMPAKQMIVAIDNDWRQKPKFAYALGKFGDLLLTVFARVAFVFDDLAERQRLNSELW